MTEPLTPEAWDGEAAAVVVALATGPEPIADEGVFRHCTLCEGQAVTVHSDVRHHHDCPWKRARRLMR